ncbi:MAG: hypothetical protein AB1711_11515, partial [Thermodesulfobacteriota bacterium]
VTIFHGYAPFFKLVFTNWLSFAKRSIAFLKLSRPLWNIASSFPKRGIKKRKKLPARLRKDPQK